MLGSSFDSEIFEYNLDVFEVGVDTRRERQSDFVAAPTERGARRFERNWIRLAEECVEEREQSVVYVSRGG